MDFEDYLSFTYTPTKAIEVLSDLIYEKCNNDWQLCSKNCNRNDFDELIALNFLIKLSAEYLMNLRKTELNELYTP